MSFKLKRVKIGDVVEVTDYVANGSFASLKANVKYLDNSSPEKFAVLVRTLDFNRNWNGEYVWVDKAGFEFLKKSSLRKDDLVLCNVSSVGIVFEIPDLGFPMTLGPNSVLCRTKDVNLVRQKFLYYYFLSSAGQALLQELSGGSTVQPKFNKTLLRNSEIEVPDLAHQDLLIKMLGSLDSKISVNEALSKTLEDIAQTLFKSWFIDFDPVNAKMAEEKPAGMDGLTAALFPDSMEESELGLIPKGWTSGTLDDVIEIYDSRRIPLASAERKKRPGRYPYYGATGALDFIDDFLFEGPHVLVGEDGTVITDSGSPLVQYVWNKFWVSNHAHVLKARNGFTVEQLKLLIENIQISNYITGAVQPKLTQGNLKSIPCVIPTAAVSGAFGKIIEPIFEQVRHLIDENKILVELRDSLLPRLISGELQIPEDMLAS